HQWPYKRGNDLSRREYGVALVVPAFVCHLNGVSHARPERVARSAVIHGILLCRPRNQLKCRLVYSVIQKPDSKESKRALGTLSPLFRCLVDPSGPRGAKCGTSKRSEPNGIPKPVAGSLRTRRKDVTSCGKCSGVAVAVSLRVW